MNIAHHIIHNTARRSKIGSIRERKKHLESIQPDEFLSLLLGGRLGGDEVDLVFFGSLDLLARFVALHLFDPLPCSVVIFCCIFHQPSDATIPCSLTNSCHFSSFSTQNVLPASGMMFLFSFA